MGTSLSPIFLVTRETVSVHMIGYLKKKEKKKKKESIRDNISAFVKSSEIFDFACSERPDKKSWRALKKRHKVQRFSH